MESNIQVRQQQCKTLVRCTFFQVRDYAQMDRLLREERTLLAT